MCQVSCQYLDFLNSHAVFSEQLEMNLAIFAMSDFIEQRSCIKFCLPNEISCGEMLRTLQKAFGDHSISQKNVYKRYKQTVPRRQRHC